MSHQSATAYCRITLHVEDVHRQRVEELVLSSLGPTQAKRGCRRCLVSSYLRERRSLTLIIEWADREGLHQHLGSDDFWPVLLAIDLGSQEPDVVIGELTADSGMELLQRIRASA